MLCRNWLFGLFSFRLSTRRFPSLADFVFAKLTIFLVFCVLSNIHEKWESMTSCVLLQSTNGVECLGGSGNCLLCSWNFKRRICERASFNWDFVCSNWLLSCITTDLVFSNCSSRNCTYAYKHWKFIKIERQKNITLTCIIINTLLSSMLSNGPGGSCKQKNSRISRLEGYK